MAGRRFLLVAYQVRDTSSIDPRLSTFFIAASSSVSFFPAEMTPLASASHVPSAVPALFLAPSTTPTTIERLAIRSTLCASADEVRHDQRTPCRHWHETISASRLERKIESQRAGRKSKI